jgi:hypothetical protein
MRSDSISEVCRRISRPVGNGRISALNYLALVQFEKQHTRELARFPT